MSRAAIRRHQVLDQIRSEPVINWQSKEDQEREYQQTLSTYTYHGKFSNSNFRKWILEFFKEKDSNIHRQLKNVKKFYHEMKTVGAILRMASLDNGLRFEWDPSLEEFVNKTLKAVLEKDKEANPQNHKPAASKPSIQTRMQNLANAVIEDFEGMEDKLMNGQELPKAFTPMGFLQRRNISAKVTKMVEECFEPKLLEVEQFLALPRTFKPVYDNDGELKNDSDELQLVEGYADMSKKEVKALFNFYQSIIHGCQQHRQSSVKNRAPRAKKIIPLAKKAEKINYMREYDDFELKSISPTKLFGANEIWIFNTKYYKLVRYVSDGQPMTVKGTTIKGFDIKKSMEVKVRKAGEFFKELTLGKRNLSNAIKNLTTKSYTPTGRVNKDCIILAAY